MNKLKASVIDGRECKLCRFCGQPMKPNGIKKLPDEYDHAQGCPYSRRAKEQEGAVSREAGGDAQ